MNKYEAIVMFYPDVEEEKRNAAFERLQKILTDGGNVTKVDQWGMRKLAYEIEYYQEAYYILVEFEADPKTVEEFDRVAKILDSVMRQMIVRLDK